LGIHDVEYNDAASHLLSTDELLDGLMSRRGLNRWHASGVRVCTPNSLVKGDTLTAAADRSARNLFRSTSRFSSSFSSPSSCSSQVDGLRTSKVLNSDWVSDFGVESFCAIGELGIFDLGACSAATGEPVGFQYLCRTLERWCIHFEFFPPNSCSKLFTVDLARSRRFCRFSDSQLLGVPNGLLWLGVCGVWTCATGLGA
jgi:hypothetical protein